MQIETLKQVNNLTVTIVVFSFSSPFTLQIDCQGCEYDAMPPLFDLISSRKVSVNQVLIELHNKSPQILNDFFLAAHRAKFGLSDRERNQWGCDGSHYVEHVFVSEAFLREANGSIICPSIGDHLSLIIFRPCLALT